MATTPANDGKKKPEQGDKVEKTTKTPTRHERIAYSLALEGQVFAYDGDDPDLEEMFEQGRPVTEAKPKMEEKTHK
ncbi:hypothetical protein NW752_003098 [Fusarium irregulare]|uniref:Uncharacterized protein n=1 Tax=Fusarium irregulare TaxID=2494466 RepID=A0A9W8Q1J0_9HYPO|nr:hypothetical protein NW766_000766 [Fusarium irregulare]KAJ4025625.1 hypothetical protein NW752_003098 [Fusarium irregulare]